MTSSVECTQINLHHAKDAAVRLNARKEELVFITEPHLTRKNAKLDNANGKVFSARGRNPRAALRINEGLNPWIVTEFTNRDVVTASVKLNGIQVYVSSIYLDINIKIAEQAMMLALMKRCENRRIPLVIGMDSNSHSSLWGCTEDNVRGDALEELFAEHFMTVCNTGNVPTFKTSRAQSIIDLTIMNSYASIALNVEEWRVDTEEYSSSDHRYIHYNLGKYRPKKDKFRNFKKADWNVLNEELNMHNAPSIFQDGSNIDVCAQWLEDEMSTALEKCCPMTAAITRKPNPWWSPELDALSEEKKVLFKNSHKSRSALAEYKTFCMAYNRKIDRARRDNWRTYASETTSAKDMSKLIASLEPKPTTGIGLISRADKSSLSPKESLNALMDTHFPDSVPEAAGSASLASQPVGDTEHHELYGPLTEDKHKKHKKPFPNC